MATEAPPRCYRRLRKASDLSAISAAAPSKRVLARPPPSPPPLPALVLVLRIFNDVFVGHA